MTMTLRVRVGAARSRRQGRRADGVYFVFAGRDATLALQEALSQGLGRRRPDVG
jgi:hypothetical protein